MSVPIKFGPGFGYGLGYGVVDCVDQSRVHSPKEKPKLADLPSILSLGFCVLSSLESHPSLHFSLSLM
ncbi:hypothetical protein L484_013166 [Morus notabilis]|uniref:Uncharacterized protein n=1 Tax=Morus notabilis TaxID=981085 RepID=W9S0L0_9ROSA|nr:hypothetical protein L484_013166 [Morus notabilis]